MVLLIKQMAKSTIFRISSCVLLLLAGGFWAAQHFAKPKKQIVAEVGPYQITEEEVQYQMALNSIMNSQATDRATALKQVKEINAYDLIMQKYGWKTKPEDFFREDERIQKNTRARHNLEKIRALQGFDPQLYQKIFLRGTLLRRQIFKDFYFSTAELHQTTKGKALQFADQMETQKQEQIVLQAQRKEWPVFQLSLDESSGLLLKQISAQPANSLVANPPQQEVPVQARRRMAEKWLQEHQKFERAHRAFLFNEGEKWGLFFPEDWRPHLHEVKGLYVVIRKQPFQEWLKKEMPFIERTAEGSPL